MGLLSLPMAELKRRVEKRRYARMVLQRAVKGGSKPAAPASAVAAADDDAAVEEQEAGADKAAVEGPESRESTPSKKSPAKAAVAPAGGGKSAAEREREQLWVHRYSPSAFAHLLSDEAINREVWTQFF